MNDFLPNTKFYWIPHVDALCLPENFLPNLVLVDEFKTYDIDHRICYRIFVNPSLAVLRYLHSLFLHNISEEDLTYLALLNIRVSFTHTKVVMFEDTPYIMYIDFPLG